MPLGSKLASGFSPPMKAQFLQCLPRPVRSVKQGRRAIPILPSITFPLTRFCLRPSRLATVSTESPQPHRAGWLLQFLQWWLKSYLTEIFLGLLTEKKSTTLPTLTLLYFFHRTYYTLFPACFFLLGCKFRNSRDVSFTAVILAPNTVPGT